MSNTPKTPQSSAAGAYASSAQTTTTDPRELEARVLLKAVHKMQALQKNWDNPKLAEDLDDTLRFNRQIWMMFVDHAATDQSPDRPRDLRSNIANLGAYVFKRSIDILSDPKPEMLDVLIDINREVAAGLMTSPKPEA